MPSLKKCLFCNNIFDRPLRSKKSKYKWKVPWCSYNKLKFCSIKCRSIYHGLHMRGANNANWRGGKTRCIDCNKELPYRYSYRKNIRCKSCWYKFHRGSNHINWKGGEVKKNCLTCGKEFWTKPSSIKKGNGKYCSSKCYGLSEEMRKKASKNNKGEKSHWWKGGISPINRRLRASRRFKHWREAVFLRDNWTCWICDKRGSVKLHPHHLKKFSDYPKFRFDINNGLTLCEFCHKTYTNFRH